MASVGIRGQSCGAFAQHEVPITLHTLVAGGKVAGVRRAETAEARGRLERTGPRPLPDLAETLPHILDVCGACSR